MCLTPIQPLYGLHKGRATSQRGRGPGLLHDEVDVPAALLSSLADETLLCLEAGSFVDLPGRRCADIAERQGPITYVVLPHR